MKNTVLIVLVFLLLIVGGLVVLNKDRFKTPLQMEENKTTQTAVVSPTPLVTPSPSGSVDVNIEVNYLDKTLNSVNPNDLNGSDLSNTAVGAQ